IPPNRADLVIQSTESSSTCLRNPEATPSEIRRSLSCSPVLVLDGAGRGELLQPPPTIMAKITPLTGFPEWLPEQRLVEQRVIDDVRRKFELFGFAPLETRSVEPLDVLT